MTPIIVIIGKPKWFTDCIKGTKERFPIIQFPDITSFEQWEQGEEGMEERKNIAILMIENTHHEAHLDEETALCSRICNDLEDKPVIIVLDADKHPACEQKYLRLGGGNHVDLVSKTNLGMIYKQKMEHLWTMSQRK